MLLLSNLVTANCLPSFWKTVLHHHTKHIPDCLMLHTDVLMEIIDELYAFSQATGVKLVGVTAAE